MRFQFLAALVMTVVGAGSFWYQTTAAVCPVPLAYRVGTIDSHFSITKEEAKARLLEAEAVWEKQTGRELFVYDENAAFVVDFIYDERQEEANNEVSDRAHLDEKKKENDGLIAAAEVLQKKYEELSATYATQVQQYETRLSAYNDKVSSYNDQGGAPGAVFEELERTRKSLDRESQSLNQTADELNALADEVNAANEKSNQLVESYNKEVEAYNEKYGYEKEFTQGDYDGTKINIYKFSDNNELVTVLTHEFGHALGIDHVDDESSVMYYLLGDTNDSLLLSKEDVEAFTAQCGTGTELPHKVRAFIRSAL